jgi:malate dehydrogenase (oxaloacetate-decarboxylating)
MKKPDIGKKALALHKKLGGKTRTALAVPVRNRADLSLVYTPGVAAVSTYVATHPAEARRYTGKGRTVAVVSDGSAVLGLGNIGPLGALPVMEGKAMLFKAFGGVEAVPIVLDVHTADEIVSAVKAIAPGFGGINLEDIAAPQCFEIERRLIEELDIPVMHDDQHGTAIVVLAALINALKLTKREMGKARIVISGAGAAGVAIANLLRAAGVRHVIVLDSKGIISMHRPDLSAHKRELADWTNPEGIRGGLKEALTGADVLIGVSGPGLATAADIRLMNPKPIVFAMANPTPEIMPDEAKKGGAYIIGTGRSDFPNQINNSLAFPGLFRGVLDAGLLRITEEMKLSAAKAIAALVKKPTPERIVPDMFDPKVAKAVASAVVRSRAR